MRLPIEGITLAEAIVRLEVRYRGLYCRRTRSIVPVPERVLHRARAGAGARRPRYR